MNTNENPSPDSKKLVLVGPISFDSKTLDACVSTVNHGSVYLFKVTDETGNMVFEQTEGKNELPNSRICFDLKILKRTNVELNPGGYNLMVKVLPAPGFEESDWLVEPIRLDVAEILIICQAQIDRLIGYAKKDGESISVHDNEIKKVRKDLDDLKKTSEAFLTADGLETIEKSIEKLDSRIRELEGKAAPAPAPAPGPSDDKIKEVVDEALSKQLAELTKKYKDEAKQEQKPALKSSWAVLITIGIIVLIGLGVLGLVLLLKGLKKESSVVPPAGAVAGVESISMVMSGTNTAVAKTTGGITGNNNGNYSGNNSPININGTNIVVNKDAIRIGSPEIYTINIPPQSGPQVLIGNGNPQYGVELTDPLKGQSAVDTRPEAPLAQPEIRQPQQNCKIQLNMMDQGCVGGGCEFCLSGRDCPYHFQGVRVHHIGRRF